VYTLLCSADHVIFILIKHHVTVFDIAFVTVFVLGKWDRHSLHGDREIHYERFSKNHLLYQLLKCLIYSESTKISPKNTRKTFQSTIGLATLANSSLATTVGPGGEISLVTLRDLLAE